MIPSSAPVGSEAIDPSDIADFAIDLSPMLEAGESFAEITFDVMPQASALGFRILNAAPHTPENLGDGRLRIWVSVSEENRNLAAWNNAGTTCGIEFTARTDSTPPRTFQRTIGIKVAHR